VVTSPDCTTVGYLFLCGENLDRVWFSIISNCATVNALSISPVHLDKYFSEQIISRIILRIFIEFDHFFISQGRSKISPIAGPFVLPATV
jgi:hypothetical protein